MNKIIEIFKECLEKEFADLEAKLAEKDEQIKELTTQYKIASGGEGIICEGITSNTVAKLFTKHGEIIPMGDNKEHKIFELYQRPKESGCRHL